MTISMTPYYLTCLNCTKATIQRWLNTLWEPRQKLKKGRLPIIFKNDLKNIYLFIFC